MKFIPKSRVYLRKWKISFPRCCSSVTAIFVSGLLVGYAWMSITSITKVKTTESISLKNKGENENDKYSRNLPLWIQNYLSWHRKMRFEYPGSMLFSHPDAPKLLIRTCLGLCGGLNDRLGQLPLDLYLANQTNRLLLLHWHRPVSIENFLQPNEIDWSVPNSTIGFFANKSVRVTREEMKIVRSYKELFHGFDDDQPGQDFWEKPFDTCLNRAIVGDFRNEKVLRHNLLGHLNEDKLEARLRALGESDMIHSTTSFGNIFWMFFRPVSSVKEQIQNIFNELGLKKGKYSCVHCRVRHPKAVPQNARFKGKVEEYTADKTGLPWNGDSKRVSLNLFELKCSIESENASIYNC